MLVNECAHCGKLGPAKPFESELMMKCPTCFRDCRMAKEVDGLRVYICQGAALNNIGARTWCAWTCFAVATVAGKETVLRGVVDVARMKDRNVETCLPHLKAELARLEQEAANEERLTVRFCFSSLCKSYLRARNGKKACPDCAGEMIEAEVFDVCRDPDCKEFNQPSPGNLCRTCGTRLVPQPYLSQELKKRFRLNAAGKVEAIAPDTKSSEAETVSA
jgi:hypothetical protein